MYVDVVGPLDPTVEIDPELQSRLSQLLRVGDVEAAGELLPADLLRRFCFSGTPQEIADHTVELFDAGADRVEFGTPHGVTGAEGIRLLGEQVLGAVKQAMKGAA